MWQNLRPRLEIAAAYGLGKKIEPEIDEVLENQLKTSFEQASLQLLLHLSRHRRKGIPERLGLATVKVSERL